MSYTSQSIGGGRVTPMVKELLLVTIGVFVLQNIFPFIYEWGALPNNWLSGLQVWRLGSYIFLHAGLFHLLMNMYALYMFGPPLEQTLGKHQFLVLYFLSGILGGLGWSILAAHYSVCIGASGAVFGLLVSYALLYPDEKLQLLFPPVVLKTWQFVLGYVLIELYHVLSQSGGRVANSAHLCGGIAGAIYTLILIRKYEPWRYRRATKWVDKLRDKMSEHKTVAHPVDQKRVDAILEKIGKEGIGSLTDAERKILKMAGPR